MPDDYDNPYGDPVALANSRYCVLQGRALVLHATTDPAPALAQLVHDSLRTLIVNDHYPCDGAKSAIRQGHYGFGLYEALASADGVSGLARDLFTFTRGMRPSRGFSTYLASFAEPHPVDEADFERLLWETLQRLHDLDRVHHAWDPAVSPDPADPHFAFSFAGTAFFVVGLHAASSRAARRFAWPTLVFNPHVQFEELRQAGRYTRFQQVIRRAELQLQGHINPMLSEHGTRSEAPQYSGRQVDDEWRCPFHAHDRDDPAQN